MWLLPVSIFVITCDELFPGFFVCVTVSGHSCAPYSGVGIRSDSDNLILLADWCCCFTRCLLAVVKHNVFFLTLFRNCRVFVSCCSDSRSLRPIWLQRLQLLIIVVSSFLSLLTIILHFLALMRSPQYFQMYFWFCMLAVAILTVTSL